MKGEFKGDFSRDTFDPSKHFLRVLMQQGRVSLDADWNEQADILLHFVQMLAKDIIGPFAGPANDLGFEIKPIGDGNFNIGYGRYYVDGILCENEKEDVSCEGSVADLGYYDQPDYPTKSGPSIPQLDEANDLPLLVYLDAWERHISHIEDDDIREKALGGPDTASRSKVIWQVKVLGNSASDNSAKWRDIIGDLKDETLCAAIRRLWANVVEQKLQPPNRGCLKAQAKKPPDETNPCITSPEGRYRGEANQLYRVEIHRSGKSLKNSNTNDHSDVATFKWSRDNGSVIFPICDISGSELTLEHLGRDDRFSLKVGDWVEVIDDAYTLLIQSRPSPLSKPRQLAQVDKVDLAEVKVALKLNENLPIYATIKDKHPYLRRWDYQEPDLTKQDGFSALFVEEGGCEENDGWLTLEDGVQICFQSPPPGSTNGTQAINVYQTGDYWLIPARTSTEGLEWPYIVDQSGVKIPRVLPPHGIDHHYAPLAVILENWRKNDNDCRCAIEEPIACYPPFSPTAVKKSRPAKRREG